MQICLEIDSGEEKKIQLKFSKYDSIQIVKAKIQEETKIPDECQAIFFNGNKLKDGKTLEEYDIYTENTLTLKVSFNLISKLEYFNLLKNIKLYYEFKEEEQDEDFMKAVVSKELNLPKEAIQIVEDDSGVHFELDEERVFFLNCVGNEYVLLEMNSSLTVKDILQKAAPLLEVQSDKLLLIYEGT